MIRPLDPQPQLLSARVPAFLLGSVFLAVWSVGALIDLPHALRAYLIGWLICLAIALGSMAILMLHHLTGGAWGYLIRRPAESAAMTLPLLALLFIPIAMGLRFVFPWARGGEVSDHALLQHRHLLFNRPSFLIRAAIYFAIWIFWAWRLRRLSLDHDRSANPTLLQRLRRYSASGLVLYFFTMSSAAVDWIASREVDWYSSTFGLAVIVGQGVAGIAFLILILALLPDAPDLQGLAAPERVHDLGNLLLTVVVLWSYISFAEFLVIWIGNMQEDNLWFYHRLQRGWGWVGTLIILLHFALPFVLLLFQRSKRNLPVLATIAGGVLVMRVVQVLWLIVPSSLNAEPRVVHWLDFIAPVGIAAMWLTFFLWILSRQPLIPLGFRVATEPLRHGRNEHEQPAT